MIAPAIGKQWSDRNQELSLKNDLVANLSSSTAKAVTQADEIAARGGSPLDNRNAFDDWTNHESSLTGSLVVYFPEQGTVIRMWSNTTRKPNKSGDFLGLRDVVHDYVLLSCCYASAGLVREIESVFARFSLPRAERNRLLLTRPDAKDRRAQLLACLRDRDKDNESRQRFAACFHRLGLQIFALRNAFLQEVAQAHARGFSRGWRDFIHNVSHPVG